MAVGDDHGAVTLGPFDRVQRRRVFWLLLGAPFRTRSGRPWGNQSVDAALLVFLAAGVTIGVVSRSAIAGVVVGLGLLVATATVGVGVTWVLVRQAGSERGQWWRLYERARPGQASVLAVLRLHACADGALSVTDLAASPTGQGAGGALMRAVQAEGRPLVLSAGAGAAAWYRGQLDFKTVRRGWWIVPRRLAWRASAPGIARPGVR